MQLSEATMLHPVIVTGQGVSGKLYIRCLSPPLPLSHPHHTHSPSLPHHFRLVHHSTRQSLVYGSTVASTSIKMKYSFSVLALAAFASMASAQAQIPACATKCIADATTSSTTCSVSDLACACKPANQQAIQGAATSCVLSSCGAAEAVSK
jgi:CFEM domain